MEKIREIPRTVRTYVVDWYNRFDEITDVNRKEPTPLRPAVHAFTTFLSKINNSRVIIRDHVRTTFDTVVTPPAQAAYNAVLENPEVLAYSFGIIGLTLAARGGPKRMLLGATVGGSTGAYALVKMAEE